MKKHNFNLCQHSEAALPASGRSEFVRAAILHYREHIGDDPQTSSQLPARPVFRVFHGITGVPEDGPGFDRWEKARFDAFRRSGGFLTLEGWREAGYPLKPAVESPAVESPAVETPAVESPAVETPAVESPAVESPATGGEHAAPLTSQECGGRDAGIVETLDPLDL